MSNCKIKKGIFVQHVCGKPTPHSCALCGIEVCQEHFKVLKGNQRVCLNCLKNNQSVRRSDVMDDMYMWYWLMRDDYHDTYPENENQIVLDEDDRTSFDNIEANELYKEGDLDDFYDS